MHRVLTPIQEFIHEETAGGIVLLACTVVALGWANSPWADSYTQLWHVPTGGAVGPLALPADLRHWVNDGLMTVFFFVVGLEIKRELLVGELSSRRAAALPVAAAFGGMVVPALLYAAANRGGPGAAGWGIPMATDIAFALGVLALLAGRVSTALKAFLTALAIADDLGAVLVIALFYTGHLAGWPLAAAGGLLLIMVAADRARAGHWLVFAVLGVPLWLAVLQSGIHASIAGVLLALVFPMRLGRVEELLHPWVAFGIMPLFALANAGVHLGTDAVALFLQPVALGVVLGLVAGKPVGILLASWLAVRLRVGELPADASWREMAGVAVLGGIGFTMSLFITGLAFPDEALVESAKLGILVSSAVAGAGGWLVIRSTVVSARPPR